jgi:hypothetical protein
MRVFKTRSFTKEAAGHGLTDADLRRAVQEMEGGLVDALLGGELVKKRVARMGSGKSGGFRTVIVWRQGDRAFFLHVFGKNEKANVSPRELKTLKALGKAMMAMELAAIEAALKENALEEVDYVENP